MRLRNKKKNIHGRTETSKDVCSMKYVEVCHTLTYIAYRNLTMY